MRHFKALLAVALLVGCRDKTPDQAKPDGGEVVAVAAHDVSPPLRELAKLPRPLRDADEAEEAEPARRLPLPHMHKTPGAHDPVVQSFDGATPIVATTANFEGMGAGMSGFTPGGIPPDTDGDVGPNHYVQIVNISLSVFSKTGSLMMGPMDTSMVFSGFAGACGQSNDGDGTVRYDHMADRWVISQFSIGSNAGGPYYQCVAVSTSPDPTGTYTRYQFNYNALNDYPKIGLWPDAYYFTFNMFNLSSGSFEGGKVCAMDRTKMLAGQADATMQCFDAGPNYGGLLASDVDGKNMPPAGAPDSVVALDSQTTLAYWKLHVDFATPANSTFLGPTSISVSNFSPVCDGGTCITEPTGGVALASLADRAMNRFVYRRFADHEALLLTHSVTVGAGGGVRWYEIRSPDSPTVFQEGTYAPDGAFRWLPSIAMDAAGDIASVYSVSSATVNPSVRYAARTPSDPSGTFGLGEGTIAAGAGVQQQVSRWGDYASLNIDPTDDCTFWATHEYKAVTGRSNWSTKIASFTLPSCSAFAVTADAETVQQGGMAQYMVNTATTAGAAQSLQLSVMGLPAGVTATINPTTVQSGDMTQITLTADPSATVGATHYTVVATGSASSTMTDVMLTVTEKPAMPDADNTMGSGSGNGGNQGGGCCGASPSGSPLTSTLLGLGVALVLVRRRRAAR